MLGAVMRKAAIVIPSLGTLAGGYDVLAIVAAFLMSTCYRHAIDSRMTSAVSSKRTPQPGPESAGQCQEDTRPTCTSVSYVNRAEEGSEPAASNA